MSDYNKTPPQKPAPPKPSSVGGLLLLGLGAFIAYATSNRHDPKVNRFRDRYNGQFRSGRWG